MEARGRQRQRWIAVALESGVLLGLFAFYLFSFDLSSPVNGPYEVFAQDSVYILKYLDRGEPFRWNPQSHLLYHVVVERGYALWQSVIGPGDDSTYRYLKLFTALCGLAFFAGMRWLFVELGLTLWQRIVLLLLGGVSVSAWFHFAAFETHCLALPALALYLVALARLKNRRERTLLDHALLVGSLLVCGWTRVDLFRLAAASGVLLLLPSLRRHRRGLATDLVLVVVLGIAGNAWLASTYLEEPLGKALTASFARDDRRELAGQLGQASNLRPESLLVVGRAVSLYGLVMPVEKRPEGRSFLAPPTYDLDLQYSGEGVFPSTDLFLKPARHLLGYALSALALAGVAAALSLALGFGITRVVSGDAFHTAVLVQAFTGWIFYTWFNPMEPFLWSAEFMPLWIALVADWSRGRGRAVSLALGALAVCVWLHNWFAFYLPFR